LIALPTLNEARAVPEYECNICQKTGTPIVRVTLTRFGDGVPDVAGGGSYGPGQTLERISLVAFKRANALGFCELSVPTGGGSATNQLKCNIYRTTGDLFATVEEEPRGVVSSLLQSSSSSTFGSSSYLVTVVATNSRFWIRGDIANRNITVVKESDKSKPVISIDPGENLQFKEDSSCYYRLRVQPKTDAGVFIMALLAIDRLPGSHRS